jgi:hypothetical protein
LGQAIRLYHEATLVLHNMSALLPGRGHSSRYCTVFQRAPSDRSNPG